MDILTGGRRRTVEKGTILLHAGDVCHAGYAVISGCLRSYVADKSGKEHILQFAPEGWYISDMDSFFHQKPAVMWIDAIYDSEVVVMTREMYAMMEKEEKDTVAELNVKLRNNLIATNKRLIALLSAPAEKRYNDFVQTYPTLTQRLPLKLIASYIGVTPEYLSEIRRKIAGK